VKILFSLWERATLIWDHCNGIKKMHKLAPRYPTELVLTDARYSSGEGHIEYQDKGRYICYHSNCRWQRNTDDLIGYRMKPYHHKTPNQTWLTIIFRE